MLSRRQLVGLYASLAIGAEALGIEDNAALGDNLLRPNATNAIQDLERRLQALYTQPHDARPDLQHDSDAFSRNKERLLDVMDRAAMLGPRARDIFDEAGLLLTQLTADEARTPRPRFIWLHNGLQARRIFPFDERLRQEYRHLFQACRIREDHRKAIERDVRRASTAPRKPAYLEIEARTGVPWYLVAAIHNLEASFNLSCHLHNGDSLNARTVHVPKNRPRIWQPPSDWASSAMDALDYDGFLSAPAEHGGWSLELMLYQLERYNGIGYRMHRIPSPYLWSFSNQYKKGKYVADGKWDPEAVSRQCGAATLMKAMVEKGLIAAPRVYG